VFRQEEKYAFLHDRVQEAAYSLIPEDSRAAEQLRVGRLLCSRLARSEIEERIFDIVNHFNRTTELLASREEREDVRPSLVLMRPLSELSIRVSAPSSIAWRACGISESRCRPIPPRMRCSRSTIESGASSAAVPWRRC
jgi:hypothetical protein